MTSNSHALLNIEYTRNLIIWLSFAVYFFAFASIYHQAPGLYGPNGILPVRRVLQDEPKDVQEFLKQPSVLRFLPGLLGVDAGQAFELLAMFGSVLSMMAMIFGILRSSVTFALLWISYFSLFQVGQTFMWFQWDLLLLEHGFLMILVASLVPIGRVSASGEPHQPVTLWLLRWLLFRLMLHSGIVKLQSNCPTWWGLTALEWHYESQCIPTPLAWWAHQLPASVQQLSVAAVFIIQIPLALALFAPVRALRLLGGVAQILLMVLILLTGNYNFFNLQTIVLSLSVFDDQCFGVRKPSSVKASAGPIVRFMVSFWKRVLFLAALVWLGWILVQHFGLRIDLSEPSIVTRVTFTRAQMEVWISKYLRYTIVMGAVSLSWELLKALYRCIFVQCGFLSKFSSLVKLILYGGAALAMFSTSLVPFTVISRETGSLLPRPVFRLYSALKPLEAVNSYGLFRRMTGVGGRPELIIEGSYQLEDGWTEFEFLYKPGNLSTRPPVVAPHQPRLDWQMWFAALGSYQDSPWFLNLVHRLLTAEPDVLALIAPTAADGGVGFAAGPPRFVRARLYTYHYTSPDASSSHFSERDWWWRENAVEYLPPLDSQHPDFVNYLQQQGIFERVEPKTHPIGTFITLVGSSVRTFEPFLLLFSVFLATVIVNLFR